MANAAVHVGRRYIANIDIKDFYPTIHFRRIVGMLTSPRYRLARPVAVAVAQLCCHEGRLPIGGATSGVLSNIVCGPLDTKLMRLAKRNHLRYSRYVDDITLSSTNPEAMRLAIGVEMYGKFIVRDASSLSSDFTSIFTDEGFTINTNKVWIVSRQARQQVTSLVTNKKVNVRREYARSIRGAIHAIEKFGLEDAQSLYLSSFKTGKAKKLSDNLAGRLAFLGHVTGYDDKYTQLATRFMAAVDGYTLPTPLVDRERAVYHIETPGGDGGTAFHIGDGVFVTAAHVVEKVIPGEWCTLHVPGHYPSPIIAELVAEESKIDVAVLHGPLGLRRPALDFRGAVANRGVGVTAYGYPQFNGRTSCSHIQATVTASRDLFGYRRMEVSTPWPHGISGGPVFLSDGKLAGIVMSGPVHGDVVAPFATCLTRFADIADFVSRHRARQTPSNAEPALAAS